MVRAVFGIVVLLVAVLVVMQLSKRQLQAVAPASSAKSPPSARQAEQAVRDGVAQAFEQAASQRREADAP